MDGPINRERRPISDDTQTFGPVGEPPAGARSSGWVLGDRYRVLERIGSGGMAEVFRARDEVLQRDVAAKVFRSEHFAAGDAHGRERQQLEVQALARLNHPNLITLYDGCVDGSTPHAYIVMELIDGPSLAARIAEGPLPEASVREIGIQLADGLAYVHEQGMVHRDVKPDNILLGVDRSDDDSTVRARLSDFGIVRLLDSERLTSVNLTLGTASYLAPEQARGSHVEPPADIYSLGLVLLEALTGVRAFDGPPLATAMARLSSRPQIPAELPAPWPALLHAMTEPDPALRPSAAEVARILRDEGSRSLPIAAVAVPVAAGFAEAPTGMTPAVDPRPVAPDGFDTAPRRRRPSGVLVAATLALFAIATTLGVFLFAGNDNTSPAETPSTGPSPVARHSSSSAAKSTSSGTSRNAPVTTPTTVRHSASTAASSSASSSAPSSTAATSSSAPAQSTSAAHTSAPATPTTTPAAASSRAAGSAASSPPSTSASAPGDSSGSAASAGSPSAPGQAAG